MPSTVMSRGGGNYSRTELGLLNARRDGPLVDINEINRVYVGDLHGVLAWFAPKHMPDEWADSLRLHFSTTERGVVAFGYPRSAKDFFVVHNVSMDAVVECSLPDDRIVPASSAVPPQATD
jgi:hypothetical protein